jgi:hypothetical protein
MNKFLYNKNKSRNNFYYNYFFYSFIYINMKSYKKTHKSKTQKIYNMKGCSLAKCKKGGKRCKMCWGVQKGGCGCAMTGGKRSRRHKKMLAYPASNAASESAFASDYLAYTGKGGQNPNLPYPNGSTPTTPFNYEFPPGVSQPQDLRGGQQTEGVINEAVVYGANSTMGGKRKNKRGGNSGKWPDGLTGSPWGGNVSQWPGVDGISGDRNYLAYNNYKYDPQTQGVINGRALSGGKSRKRRGGGLIPQDLVNLGRQAMFGLGSSYNALMGYQAPVNPMPYKDQLVGTPNVNNLQYYRL